MTRHFNLGIGIDHLNYLSAGNFKYFRRCWCPIPVPNMLILRILTPQFMSFASSLLCWVHLVTSYKKNQFWSGTRAARYAAHQPLMLEGSLLLPRQVKYKYRTQATTDEGWCRTSALQSGIWNIFQKKERKLKKIISVCKMTSKTPEKSESLF